MSEASSPNILPSLYASTHLLFLHVPFVVVVMIDNQCASELAEVRSWADERIAAQTEQMERQSEEAKVVAARSKEETKVEVAQLMEVSEWGGAS